VNYVANKPNISVNLH